MKKSSGMKKKAMKKTSSSMKRKAKKVSIVGRGRMAKVMVFRGSKQKTGGGLKKGDLVKNKHGRVVSKKASQRAKTGKASKWIAAVAKARKAMNIKGFQAIGG